MSPRRMPGLAVLWAALLILPAGSDVAADGPKDNLPDNVRPIPPKGSPVPPADVDGLKAGLDEFARELAALPPAMKGKPALLDLLPDVEVYEKAVRYAIELDEFYVERGRNDVAAAKQVLAHGMDRLRSLKDGKAPWVTQTGLVVRGYRSKIDGSVQPYGLVVPVSYSPTTPHRFRLDFWWHGREEMLTEVDFIRQREARAGEFTPQDAFVLFPYGRFCNANKFAGEVDTFECLEHARTHYPIDEDRLIARGFSMGGAACWHFAAHHPTRWAAAAPGAGFAETPEFLNNFQGEAVKPTWYEQKLWHLYNATDYALNLFNLPTVAYSGEIDRQKQAADVMAREMKKVGLELTHVIGPKTAHKYEPGAKAEVNRRIDAIARRGRVQVPEKVAFTTWTLRYDRCAWLRVDRLDRHWEPAVVTAELGDKEVTIRTKNVAALSLQFEPGSCPFDPIGGAAVKFGEYGNGPTTTVADTAKPQSDRSLVVTYRKFPAGWAVERTPPVTLEKRHGLQGPIDDAFMDRFLMVRPTGQPLTDKNGAWAAGEMRHAVEHWKRHFRGEAPVKDDTAVTADDIRDANLVLWGDPASNAVLAKVADRLPVKWGKDGLTIGDETYDPATHVPVLIYPNPLNPAKYVVINSGFTFREYDYLNNARQVPKLPDYAVIDITIPPNSRWPGKVARAGFFGEKWELLPDDGK